MGVREQDSYDLSLVTPTLLIWALDYQILQGINAITISIGTLGLIIILIRLVNRTIQKRPKHSERLGNNIHLLLIATVILSVLNLTAAHLEKIDPQRQHISTKCLNPCTLEVQATKSAVPVKGFKNTATKFILPVSLINHPRIELKLSGTKLDAYKTNDILKVTGKLIPQTESPSLGIFKVKQIKLKTTSFAHTVSNTFDTTSGKTSPTDTPKTNSARGKSNSLGLVKGMTLGDLTLLTPTEIQAIRTAGASHLVAISGLHLAILLQLLTTTLPGRPREKSLTILAILTAVIAAVGWQPSILRAASMAAVSVAATLFKRHSQGINSLALVCLLWLSCNPWLAHSIGFILSALATATVISVNLWQQRLTHYENPSLFEHYRQTLITIIALPVLTHLVTATATVIFLNRYATYGILTNILISGFVPFITGGGVIAILTGNLNTHLGQVFLYIAQTAAKYALGIMELIATLPGAQLENEKAWIALGAQWGIVVSGLLFQKGMRCLKHGCEIKKHF